MSTREQQARAIIATREQNARAMESEIAAWQQEIGPTPSTHEIAISPLNVPLIVGDDMEARRRARNGVTYPHNAIDVFAQTNLPSSDVGVVATVSGRVLFVGEWDPASGYTVFIGGRDGRIYSYAHLESSTLLVGQSVTQGATIGVYGNSGNATHHEDGNLHYTVREPINAAEPLQPVNASMDASAVPADSSEPNQPIARARLADPRTVWPTIKAEKARTGMTFQPGITAPSVVALPLALPQGTEGAEPIITPDAPPVGPVTPTGNNLPSSVSGGEQCEGPGAPCYTPMPMQTGGLPPR